MKAGPHTNSPDAMPENGDRGPPDLPLIARHLVAGSLILCTIILALVGYALYEERVDAMSIARQSGANLRAAVANEVASHLGQLDLVLQVVAGDLSDPNIAALDPRARHEVLARTARYLGRAGSMFMVAPDGNIALDAARFPPRDANLADRDYFRAQRDDPNTGIYVSAPFMSRLNPGVESIALSRRVTDASGRFAGVVAMTVPIDYFRAVFRHTPHSRLSTLALARTQGQLIARDPSSDGHGDIGREIASLPLFTEVSRQGSGEIIAPSPLHGTRQLFIFGPVPDMPLMVVVGQPLSEIYAVWGMRVVIMGSMAISACIGLVTLAVLLRHELHRRLAAESEMAEMAITDALTGLANRRRFNEVMSREWRRTARTGSPLALLLIDADHFKRLNDSFGHARGDTVLQTLGQVIQRSIRRPADLGARYGGEEFAVVLPDTDLAGAQLIAEKIRAGMEDESARLGDRNLPGTTVSIGAASTLPVPGRPLEDLVETADQALYAAKAAGRNTVVARACL